MNGTTLCPHCSTRFNISEAQLTAHQGMVRCGHCMQAFDARPGFIPDVPSPQLALPIEEPATHDAGDESAIELPLETVEPEHAESGVLEPKIPEPEIFAASSVEEPEPEISEPEAEMTSFPEPEESTIREEEEPKVALDTVLEIAEPSLTADSDHYVEHLTPAEQINTEQISEEQVDEDEIEPFVKPRIWPWALGTLIAVFLLIAQSAYFFRIDLAAIFPAAKPALQSYCSLFNCSVPYPEKSALISIESSNLDADPAHENQITLNALLRNHASFIQAFPNLSLTLSDNQDKPLARRLFTPREYLPAGEDQYAGFPANHEISVKLPLYTGTLRPVGYQLEFFYGPIADGHPHPAKDK